MKYKIGDIVQIVKIYEDVLPSPEYYIGQLVTIVYVDEDDEYFTYHVTYNNKDFQGDRDEIWWSNGELEYADKEKIIWDKLKLIADDISKLKETPDDRLRDIYYMIRNYNE